MMSRHFGSPQSLFPRSLAISIAAITLLVLLLFYGYFSANPGFNNPGALSAAIAPVPNGVNVNMTPIQDGFLDYSNSNYKLMHDLYLASPRQIAGYVRT